MQLNPIKQMYERMIREIPPEQVQDYRRDYEALKAKYDQYYEDNIEPIMIVSLASGASVIDLLRACFFIGLTIATQDREQEEFNAQFNPSRNT